MKSLPLLVAFLLFAQLLFAQDAIFLVNGSAFAGRITAYEQGGKVEITVNDSIHLVFLESQIEKIVQAEAIALGSNRSLKAAGWFNETAVAYGFGSDKYDEPTTGGFLENTVGFMFNHLLGVGAGIGVHHYDDDKIPKWVLPIFAAIRTMPFGADRNLEFSLKTGYGSIIKSSDLETTSGGLFFAPEIAYRFVNKHNKRVDWGIKLGYISQKTNYVEDNLRDNDFWGQVGSKRSYRMTLRRIRFSVVLNIW